MNWKIVRGDKKVNMGAGRLKDPNIVFTRKFRWTLSSDKLKNYVVKNVKFDFKNKYISFTAYEIADSLNQPIWIHEFLESKIEDQRLVFSTFTGCGDHIYSYEFRGLELLRDVSSFDYDSSDVACRKVKIAYQTKSKVIPVIETYIMEEDPNSLKDYVGRTCAVSINSVEIRNMNESVFVPGKNTDENQKSYMPEKLKKALAEKIKE